MTLRKRSLFAVIRIRKIGQNIVARRSRFGAGGFCTKNSDLFVKFVGVPGGWTTEIVLGRFGCHQCKLN